MLRLHFTLADLARVRVADRPDAQLEVIGALRRLQGAEAGVLFDGWRRRVRTHVDGGGRPVLPRLFDLVPRTGPIAGLLVPQADSRDPQRWLDDLCATPRGRVRDSLERYARVRDRPLRGWLRELADSRGALPELADALRAFARVAIEPVWASAVASVAAERARWGRDLLDGGLDRLLTGLPGVHRWDPPVLVTHCATDGDVHLAGRGMVLVPSYFGWSSITLVERSDADPLMLAYPMYHRVLAPPANRTRHSLAAALGRTRAAVLELIAEASATGSGTGATTGELSRRLAVAAGTVSWHVAALREAGLVTTRRNRHAVHSLLPAGRYLLERPPGPVGFRASSNPSTATP
jgi:DNA-binding transcriptional ArsR family regulator